MSVRFSRPIALGVGLVGLTGALSGCAGQPTVDHSYADGLFRAVGDYISPAGPQGISVAVQLKDDTVAWVMVTPRTFIGEPAEFQNKFAKAAPDEVVGRDVDTITVSRLAGASLTSDAFNQALADIKAQALED